MYFWKYDFLPTAEPSWAVVSYCQIKWTLSLLVFYCSIYDSFAWVYAWMKFTLTLKAPRKNASEKWRLLKSSAANSCLTLLTNLSIEASKVDPEQTAPIGAVWSGSTLFAIEASLKTYAAISNAHLFRFFKRGKLSGSCLSTLNGFGSTQLQIFLFHIGVPTFSSQNN